MDTFLLPIQFNVKNSEHVYLLQQILVLVLKEELGGGKSIAQDEILNREYGDTTQESVVYFQEKYGLVQSPEVSEETVNMLNNLAKKRYIVYGIITDDANLPVEGVVQKLYHKLFNTTDGLIGEGISLKDGSYRIYLDFTGKESLLQNGVLKNQLCSVIEFSQDNTNLFTSEEFFVSELETLQDFSSEKFIYTGDSTYISTQNILTLNGIHVEDLILKTFEEIQTISSVTDIGAETLMRLMFAVYLHQASASFPISIENAFGYLLQNFPPNMPVNLYDATIETDEDWYYYKEEKKKFILAGMELLAHQEHVNILTNAVKLRYISRLTKDEIISLVDDMLEHKYELLEVLPILEGNISISEVSNVFKNIIVDNPSIWTTGSRQTKSISSPIQAVEKAQKVGAKSYIELENLIERDFENTGGDQCEFLKIDDYTFEFRGNVSYATSLISTYRFNAFPSFGNYIGFIIRIPKEVENLTSLLGQIQDEQGNSCNIYYKDLSIQELQEGYIHVYLNLSTFFDFENNGYIHDNNYRIEIHWGDDFNDETFHVRISDVYLEPCKNESGIPTVKRDFFEVGGVSCEFLNLENPHEIVFRGMVSYTKSTHVRSLVSGYYAGVAIIMQDRMELHNSEWRISLSYENGTIEKKISWDMLSQEERSGGFVHVYFNLYSEYGKLVNASIDDNYFFNIEAFEISPFVQIERDMENIGGAVCIAHTHNDQHIEFSGDLIYSYPPVVRSEGHYFGVYIYPPFTIGEYDMTHVNCMLSTGEHIAFDNLTEDEKLKQYIHVLIDASQQSDISIDVDWGELGSNTFMVSSIVHLINPEDHPIIPEVQQGSILRDVTVGGNNCQSTTNGNYHIAFNGEIAWSENPVGNCIAINIFAPNDISDLSHLSFSYRTQSGSYNTLTSEEKNERRINIVLNYDKVPSSDFVSVNWASGRSELFNISIESGTILAANPTPPEEKYDYDQWKITLTEIFTNNISSYDGFVAEVKEREDELYPADVQRLITCFDVSRVTMNYPTTMEKVLAKPEVDTYGARGLATFSKNDYLSLLGNEDFPVTVPGDTIAEKRDNYATIITDSAQKLYPEIYVVSEIERKQTIGEITKFDRIGEIKELLLDRPEFDLLTGKVEDLQITVNEVREQLTSIQDIYKVTPTPKATVAFIEAGFVTANEIYSIGKEQVVTKLEGKLSQNDAEITYKASTASTAELLTAYSDIHNDFHIADFSVFKFDNDAVKRKISEDTGIDLPTLNDLFGDAGSYCSCEHDSSVYSAAAYLGDLLYYLKNRNANKDEKDTSNVKTHLIARRPDIDKIKLNKQNTVTIMPYIDIVCEVLEETLLKTESASYQRIYPEQYQSSLTSKELLAAPEHILSIDGGGIQTAYHYLKDKVYPMYAPLNLYQTEIKTYLDILNIKRYELMQTFQVSNEESEIKAPLDVDIACQYFELTSYEQKIITQQENIDIRNQAWRKKLSGDGLTTMLIADFMNDSGLSIYETIDICNEENGGQIRWSNISLDSLVDCNYNGKNVTGSKITFDRAHRFIRLWRKSDWKIWELDILLRSNVLTADINTNDNLDDNAISNLMIFKKQQEELGLPVEDLLAFYENINTSLLRENGKEILCLYDRLFLRKALSNPLNERLALIKNNTTTVIEETDSNLVMASLSITESDYLLLKNVWNDSPKNIDYLSFLYRNNLLAKKMKISIEDLLTIIRLMEHGGKIINNKAPYSLLMLNDIIDTIKKIKDSKLSIAEYEYLALYTIENVDNLSGKAKTIVLTDEQIKEYSLKLDSVFAVTITPPKEEDIELKDEHLQAIDSYKDYFTNYLLATQQYNNPDDIALLIQCIECTSGKNDKDINEFIDRLFEGIPEFLFNLELHNISILDKETLIERYCNVGYYVDMSTQITAIYNYVSEFFSFSTEMTALFLTYPMKGDESELLTLLYRIKSESASQEELFKMYHYYLILLHKPILLIQKNAISFEELELLLETQNKLDFIWYFLIISQNDSHVESIVNIYDMLQLNGILSLHRNYGISSNGQTLLAIINDYIEKTDPAEKQQEEEKFYRAICRLIGWEYSQFFKKDSEDNNVNILELKVPDFYQSQTYLRVSECYSLASNAKVTIDTLNTWKYRQDEKGMTEKDRCSQVKDAAKANYTLDQWLDKLPEIQKPIRETKSDALASYLIAHSLRGKIPNVAWKDKNDLYAYFLLDVEMSACMKISRIVQATSSVQLFVQRCFLNLEPNVNVDAYKDTRWVQWEWMKKYRLWEANRKVFLYPENWIEPELRDNKTIFFKELEDELAQGEITAANVETAFENYLQKLNDVSNLTVCGVFNEIVNDDDGIELPDKRKLKTSRKAVVHVIGRTKSIPYQYYYRTYDAYAGEWKEWEKIELDIQSDMVVPIVYNRKLHLFWLSVVPKSINQSKPNDAKNSIDYAEVQLVWSVLKNGKWAGENRSQRKLISTVLSHKQLINYSLMISVESNFLILNIFIGPDSASSGTKTYINTIGHYVFDGDIISAYNVAHISSTIWNDLEWNTRPTYTPPQSFDVWIRRDFYPVSWMYANRVYMGNNNKSVQILGNSNYSSAFELLNTDAPEPNIITNLYSKETDKTILSCLSDSFVQSYFFYQDLERSFFIEPFKNYFASIMRANSFNLVFNDDDYTPKIEEGKNCYYSFHPFYHPYTKLFIKELNRAGIDGLLNRDLQLNPNLYYPQNEYDFKSTYNPDEKYVLYDKNSGDKCVDFLDFSYAGAYSNYNWELFFHVPLYLACKLSQDQKFEEAMRWFHYIFNPTTKEVGSSPQKFWVTKIFYEMTTNDSRAQQIENILSNIKTQAQSVNVWLNNPYNPHAVARTRPIAYQRTVVMKYLNNLIAWADQLFRQDSMESNNEATLLYILAYEILGKRPVALPEKQLENKINAKDSLSASPFEEFKGTFIPNSSTPFTEKNSLSTTANFQLTKSGDAFRDSSYFVVLEQDNIQQINTLQFKGTPVASTVLTQYRSAVLPSETKTNNETIPTEFDVENFCIPPNEEMLKFWDIIEDRLYKLRNCMNIEGIVRELPLFEPPIDPAMLVKAAAAGLSIGEALNDITAPQPYYRFRTILQKAVEYTSEVKQLGDKLLSALEKKDAETLNILRSTQEINLQQASVQVRKLQIDEAKENIENINCLIATTTARKEYYESKEFMNVDEKKAYEIGISACVLDTIASQISAVATGLSTIPQFNIGGSGLMGTPVATTTFGGQQISAAVHSAAMSISGIAKTLDKSSSFLLTQAGYQRRQEEWQFQTKMATMELTQLQPQLAAAEIRLMVAEKELKNMQMQIEQSKSVLEYYKDKYTNEALYNWMITQVSSIYFQSYKLAYDMAKKAEKCYQHELGIYDPSNFIQFDNWDSLKKGLLSGEKLMRDLHKLDASYLDKNKRTLELTKHVSLAQMFPIQLIELITTGNVSLDLEEFIFDMDYPGHYMRRIKSVSVTIPNVAGSYTNVSFMLTLQSAKVRKNTSGSTYDETLELNDPRFVYQTGGRESICTSSAQNDSGMFELNFGDERYLPFENAGVISRWGLSLPAGVNQFDLSTISDVILHINYTALSDGNLALKAKAALKEKLPTAGALLFSPKQDFPDAWNQMDANNKTMCFELKTENLPFFLRGKVTIVNTISIMLSSKDIAQKCFSLSMTKDNVNIPIAMNPIEGLEGDILLFEGNIKIEDTVETLGGEWELGLGDSLDLSKIEEIIVGFSLATE